MTSSSDISTCDRCGFDKFVDVPIHNGQSVRRDCARCKLTVGFPVWYGRDLTLHLKSNAKKPAPKNAV